MDKDRHTEGEKVLEEYFLICRKTKDRGRVRERERWRLQSLTNSALTSLRVKR